MYSTWTYYSFSSPFYMQISLLLYRRLLVLILAVSGKSMRAFLKRVRQTSNPDSPNANSLVNSTSRPSSSSSTSVLASIQPSQTPRVTSSAISPQNSSVPSPSTSLPALLQESRGDETSISSAAYLIASLGCMIILY